MAKGGISSQSGLLRKRGQWGRKYNKALVKLLQDKFKDKGSKPASARDIKELAKAFEGLSPKEIKAILDKLKSDASGKGIPIHKAPKKAGGQESRSAGCRSC